MNFKGIQAISLVVFVTFTTFVQGQFNRRDEIIGDWVRRIREGPKGHSMSPSWSSKSRIPAIGVGDLPLQNEADDSSYLTNDIQINRIQAADRYQSSRSSPSTFQRHGHSPFESRPQVEYPQHGYVRPQRETPFSQGFGHFGPPKTRYQENRPGPVEPFSFDEVGFEFPSFGNSNAPGFDRPKRKIPLSQSYPDPQGYNSAEEVDDSEYQEPVYKTPYYENGNRETPRVVRHSAQGQSHGFGQSLSPFRSQAQRERSTVNENLYRHGKAKSPSLLQQVLRPKSKFQSLKQQIQELQSFSRDRTSQGQVRPSQTFGRPFLQSNQRLDEVEPTESPVSTFERTTTPRPIPTPGPEDFPPPPPTRPTVPPTHPTHPPTITHPPEHYLPSAHYQSNNLDKEVYEEDYDVHNSYSQDHSDNGFFEVPQGFPSLESLGANFESMKLRHKRSVVDLEGQEQRYNRRQFISPQQGRHRRQQNVANNDYSFQQNFWDDVDIDTRDFFPHQEQQQGGYENFGQRQRRPYKQQQQLNSYQSYQNPTIGYYGNGYQRDPYPQQSIQAYPDDRYTLEPSYNSYDNEILGSGNFEVIRGGTFYDDDTYHHANANRKPNKGQYLENFRDFADIKGEYEYKKK